MSETILITGAAGQLGRRVIHHLLETQGLPPQRLIAVTRDPAKLDDLAGRGVAVRPGSFDDEASLAGAFEGADRILIISTDAVEEPGKRLRQHRAAVAAAAKAGAGHIAYTSMLKPEPGSPIPFAPDHFETEQAIKQTGRAYTLFRNGWYQEVLLHTLPQMVKAGSWPTSAGEGRAAHVAREDVARAIAAALASGSAQSATYALTGPQALTTAEIAALTGEVTGRPVEVVQMTDEKLVETFQAGGMPEGYARFFMSFDANTRAGGAAEVSGDLETLSGRRPQPLKAFLEANRAALLG